MASTIKSGSPRIKPKTREKAFYDYAASIPPVDSHVLSRFTVGSAVVGPLRKDPRNFIREVYEGLSEEYDVVFIAGGFAAANAGYKSKANNVNIYMLAEDLDEDFEDLDELTAVRNIHEIIRQVKLQSEDPARLSNSRTYRVDPDEQKHYAHQIRISFPSSSFDIRLIQMAPNESRKMGYTIFKALASFDLELARVAFVPWNYAGGARNRWTEAKFFILGSLNFTEAFAKRQLLNKAVAHFNTYLVQQWDARSKFYRLIFGHEGVAPRNSDDSRLYDKLRTAQNRYLKYSKRRCSAFDDFSGTRPLIASLQGLCLAVLVRGTSFNWKNRTLPAGLEELETTIREDLGVGYDDKRPGGHDLAQIFADRYDGWGISGAKLTKGLAKIGRGLSYSVAKGGPNHTRYGYAWQGIRYAPVDSDGESDSYGNRWSQSSNEMSELSSIEGDYYDSDDNLMYPTMYLGPTDSEGSSDGDIYRGEEPMVF